MRGQRLYLNTCLICVVLFFSCKTQQGNETATTDSNPVFVGYVCQGSTPDWSVLIEKATITFLMLGEPQTVYPYQSPIEEGAFVRFESESTHGRTTSKIKITIEKRSCSDGMPGATYPYTAIVERDGTKYQGCAK